MCIHVCAFVCVCVRAGEYLYWCTHTRIFVYVHIHINTHILINTHQGPNYEPGKKDDLFAHKKILGMILTAGKREGLSTFSYMYL